MRKKQLEFICELFISNTKADSFFIDSFESINPSRQQRFFCSVVHLVSQTLIQSHAKYIFLLRRFDNCPKFDKSWFDIDTANEQKISELKNQISSEVDQNLVLSFILNLEQNAVQDWLKTKEGSRYVTDVCLKLTERIKTVIEASRNRNAFDCSPLTIGRYEHLVHSKHAVDLNLEKWISRKNMDEKLEDVVKNGLATRCNYYHITGRDGSGKTSFLCKLYSMLSSEHCHALIRFVNLTHSSNFSHEFWRNILINLCMLTKQDPSTVIGCFSYEEIVVELREMLLKLDRPVFILIDDAHQLRYGRILGCLKTALTKTHSNCVLVVTSAANTPMQFFPKPTELIDIGQMKNGEMIEMLKGDLSGKERRLSTDYLSVIKSQLIEGDNIMIATSMVEEALDVGTQTTLQGGLEGRFGRMEERFGANVLSAICRYISASSQGLTQLELYDLLSSNSDLLTNLNVAAFPPLLFHQVLSSMGSLLLCFQYDSRYVVRWRHAVIANFTRHRYLSGQNELKVTHCELANLFSDMVASFVEGVPTRHIDVNSYPLFPQPLLKEEGAVNLRKVKNLWFHLLHTGNLDAMKELSLCNFDYVEACVRVCGLAHFLSILEECVQQLLHHDIQVLCEQVFLPSLRTLVRDPDQIAAEVIGRLRYTRVDNSSFLNGMVEQCMQWVDNYTKGPLMVPLTCWIAPPKMKQVVSFTLTRWQSTRSIVQPTFNHQHILVSGNDLASGTIYMYHIASHLLIRTYTGHTDRVSSLSTSHSGAFFVSTSYDKSIKFWNFVENDCIKTIKPHTGRITCSLLSSDDKYLITGASDSCAKVIDVETGEVYRSFSDHTGPVVGLALTSNDEFLVTGSGDFVVMVWGIENGHLLMKMGGLMAPVTCLTMTSNDAFVAVACEDETLRVFSMVSGQELHELSGHENKIHAMVASEDDCQLFAAALSKIYCFDIHNGQLLDVMECQRGVPVTSIKITADNFFAISICGDKIQVWNVNPRVDDKAPTHANTIEDGVVTSIGMGYDERSAACGTKTGVAAAWDLDVCQCLWTVVQTKGVPVTTLAFSPDCVFLLGGNAAGLISIWEFAKGFLYKNVKVHNQEIRSICCNSDGTRVGSCAMDAPDEAIESDNFITATNIRAPIMIFPNNKDLVAQCAQSQKDLGLKLWTIADETLTVRTKLYHSEEILCYCATSVGTLLVTGSADQSLKIWQIDNGAKTVLVGHEGAVACCAIADDERLVVSGGKDAQLITWNVATGDIKQNLKTKAPLVAVCISSDASLALSADESGWIEAWSTENGVLLSSFNAHRPVRRLLSSFDGTRILTLLSGCAQLPILCLHNTPAGVPFSVAAERRRSTRTQSVSSVTSNISADSKSQALPPQTASTTTKPSGPAKSSKTFTKMERSKSRVSLIEKDRSTNSVMNHTNHPNTAKSNLCNLL
ncbi:hypothetical protein L596_005274 [Steinernema carpocapsae]|uniref:Uncharacterized protein n=1 Tax=Steinernema carpocapsae TaxID=34508 RepID=A0A4U8UYR2_STECR|nr:hypothetical protein L596_005274 [Steinernema carpocapsae]